MLFSSSRRDMGQRFIDLSIAFCENVEKLFSIHLVLDKTDNTMDFGANLTGSSRSIKQRVVHSIEQNKFGKSAKTFVVVKINFYAIIGYW
jgi:hypothetical protein